METRLTLVVGGARSGKSRFAETLCRSAADASGGALVYIATAQAWDQEMRDRIAQHQQDRGAGWTTVEQPRGLPECLDREMRADRVVLIDCLTLWLSNELLAEADLRLREADLIQVLKRASGSVICVSNEVGLGIVPDNALARRFRDAQGRLNQAVAAAADRVVFMAAGLPMVLKGAL